MKADLIIWFTIGNVWGFQMPKYVLPFVEIEKTVFNIPKLSFMKAILKSIFGENVRPLWLVVQCVPASVGE